MHQSRTQQSGGDREKKWEQAQYVRAQYVTEKRRTWKRRLSITVGLRETRMVSEK